MSLDQHYFLTEVDGKEAVWFRDIDRHKMIVQPFCLDFKDKDEDGLDWDGWIPFTIKIGDSELSSFLSNWNTDLEDIRYSLEHCFYFGGLDLHLYNDYSYTGIRTEGLSVFERAEEDKITHGTRFYWREGLVRVIVTPDEYHDKDFPFDGICVGKQVVKEIYEAFLNVGRKGYHYEGPIYGKDYNVWDCPPMVFYNKIKSPIIECYITGERLEEDKPYPRQVNVEHILTMCADVDEVLNDDKGIPSPAESDDTIEIDIDGVEYKLLVPGIYDWYRAFEKATDFVDNKLDENFDVDAWNKQGLELAAKIREQLPPSIDLWYQYPYEDEKIREQLPPSIDLWYQYPFEDEKNRGKRPMLIYNK